MTKTEEILMAEIRFLRNLVEVFIGQNFSPGIQEDGPSAISTSKAEAYERHISQIMGSDDEEMVK